jgi:hypothetical protein
LTDRSWSKSTYSSEDSACVEVVRAERVGVRDTKNRAAGALEVPAVTWGAFLTVVKDGKLGA